ncbi:MAG: hypothetical protein LBJ38_01790 [Oscillospiraceae bacterium]|jgi:YbbR domain-containing protein|nr:hypothetical protein [Oscillospiraceae bacterium]
MTKRLLQWALDQWLLKLLAFLFAFCLWFVVVNIDTQTTLDLKVPVKFDVKSIAGEMGLNPVSDEYVANVRLKGDRRVLGAFDKTKDLEVCADLSKVVSVGEYDLKLRADLLGTKEVEVVSVFPRDIKVRFDKLIARKLAVKVVLDGINVPDGYVMGMPGLATNEITVRGPEIELNGIDSCEVELSPGLVLKQTSVLQGRVKLLKEDKTVIKSENIFCSLDSMDVTIPVFKVKEVPVKFGVINQPEDFDVSTVTFSQSATTLKIGCDPEHNVNEIFLGLVDMSKLTLEDNAISFMLGSVLPADVLNIDEVDEIKVEMVAQNMGAKAVSVGSKNIFVINKPTSKKVAVLTERVRDVMLVGPSATLERLSGNNLAIMVDLRDLPQSASGKVSVAAAVRIPNVRDVWVTGNYSVHVNVS